MPVGLSEDEWRLVLQRRQQQQQQQPQMPPPAAQLGSLGMGNVEPVGDVLQPFITSQGYAASVGPTVGPGMVSAAAVTTALQSLTHTLRQEIAGLVAAGAGGQQQQLPTAAGGKQQQQQQLPAAAGGQQQQQPAAAGGQQQLQLQQPPPTPTTQRQRPFPVLSSHSSLAGLADWYSARPHPSDVAGRTPQQMEEAGHHKWRSGKSHTRRWSEYAVLINAISQKQKQLIDDQRQRDRVVHVSFVEAAQHLDQERLSLPNPNPKKAGVLMSVCQYRKHCQAGKGTEGTEAGSSGEEMD